MKKLFLLPIVLLAFQACQKSLEFPLTKDQIDIDEALNSADNLKALLNSCYDEFANIMDGDVQNLNELLGDNLSEPQNAAGSLYYVVYGRNTFSFRTADGVLTDLYNCIYRTNVFRENISRFESEVDATALEGEADFLRAYCHWEIVKLWAQPYGYTADNSHLGIAVRTESSYNVQLRSTVAEVYAQIETDLLNATDKLPENNGNYASKNAAKALLAKVYFQKNDFVNAEKYASEVINTTQFSLADSFDRYTTDATSETIFGTISTGPSDNRGGTFIGNYRSDKNDNPALKPSRALYELYDTADHRASWVEIKDASLPTEFFKCHKFDTDYFGVPLLNLTELLLIRAESLMEIPSGDKQIAASDLNAILERAYKNTTYNVTNATITKEMVRLERRKELAFEGDRVQQLKRMGAKGETIIVRGAAWNCPGMALQFPASEKTQGFIFNEEGGCN
jgi:starch-binding outer membrane protein, SusD/RagB family